MENGTLAKPAPINVFHKALTSIIGPNDTMVLPDVPATIFEGEAEMALDALASEPRTFRRLARWITFFGYINFIDGSAAACHRLGTYSFR